MENGKVLVRLLVIVAAVFLCGCSDFNAPVKDYLDEYTNSAAIGSYSISVPTERDGDGIESIPSDGDVAVTFLLRNPRSYELVYGLVISDPLIPYTLGNDYTINQSSDRQSIRMVLLESFLKEHDGTGDLSGEIALSLPPQYASRPLPSWPVSLRVNTPPSVPSGARVMAHSIGGTDTYVLCFKLDLSNAAHADVASIVINGASYGIESVTTGGAQSLVFPGNSPLSVTAPGPLTPVGNLASFTEQFGTTPVYFSSGIPVSPATQNFTVTVRDRWGLSRTAVTSTAGDMLAPVMVTDTGGNSPNGNGILTLNPDANGDYNVWLRHTESGVTLRWTIDNGPEQTHAGDTHGFSIRQSGVLRVWATKQGFIPSDVLVVQLDCRSNQYYVDPGDEGKDDATANGSQNKPFKTIPYAIEQFASATDPGNTIWLMGDIVQGQSAGETNGVVSLEPNEDLVVTIDGSKAAGGRATINGNDQVRCLYVNTNANAVQLTLRNLVVTKGKTDYHGAGIHFNTQSSSSILRIERCEVSMSNILVDTMSYRQGAGLYIKCSGFKINGYIEDSDFIENKISTPSTGYGGAIYTDGVDLAVTGTTVITGNYANISASGSRGCGGGIYSYGANLTIGDDVVVSDNTASTCAGGGHGGGIYYYGYTADDTLAIGSATITKNFADEYASSTLSSSGGGIYVSGRSTVTLTGTVISENTASSMGYGYGGGIALVSTQNPITATLSGNVRIEGNAASRSSNALYAGYGGGAYLRGVPGEQTRLAISSGSISGNFATTEDIAGEGGGVYVGNVSSFESLTGSTASIIGNYASDGTSSGKGGAVYVAPDGAATWEAGTMNGNVGSRNTNIGYGEAIEIASGGVFYLSSALGENVGSHGTAILVGGSDGLHVSGNAFVPGTNYVECAMTGTIKTVGYLGARTVAKLRNAGDVTSVLSGDMALNYYKFDVEQTNGPSYCVNAAGKISKILIELAGDLGELANILTSYQSASNDTIFIELQSPIYNYSSVITVAAGQHFRIVPENSNPNIVFDANNQQALFEVQAGGHLLVGNRDSSYAMTIDCNSIGLRYDHLIKVKTGGSLVVHNTYIKNSKPEGGSNAALVYSDGGNTVLEDFLYDYEQAGNPFPSLRSALQLEGSSVCHFVRGGIKNFLVSESGYGGVANVSSGSTLHLYNGVTLEGNTTISTPTGPKSISGPGTIIAPLDLVLN